MNRISRMLCRLLIGLVAWLPFGMAHAGMIDSAQAVSAPAQVERAAVIERLQALGVDQASAKERVAALTGEELRALAQEIDSLPAGGWSRSASLLVLIIASIAFIYWWDVRHRAR